MRMGSVNEHAHVEERAGILRVVARCYLLQHNRTQRSRWHCPEKRRINLPQRPRIFTNPQNAEVVLCQAVRQRANRVLWHGYHLA